MKHHILTAARRAAAFVREAHDELRRWVRRRIDQLANEPGYAEALVRVSLAALDLLLDSRRVKQFAYQVGSAFLAFLGGRDPDLGPNDGYWA